MMHGLDAECSVLYHQWQQTQFRAPETPKLAHTRRVLGPLSPMNKILMLRYVTTVLK